jgi:aconitate hydratase 2/2-methylisocitrate dehydratase
MLIAEKGTMGVGSSRMSGVNNVALWTGKKSKPLCSFYILYCSGNNTISQLDTV